MPGPKANPRIDIKQPREIGKLLIKWALEPDTRPKTMSEFRTQTSGILIIPDNFDGLQFTQSNRDVLYIRLPDAADLQNLLDVMGDKSGPYPLPDFYEEYIKDGLHTSLREMFEYRMSDFMLGDYSIAECM
jgi:hypothetical protein